MINEALIEDGGGKAVIDPKDQVGAIGDGRTPAPAETTPTDDEIAAKAAEDEAARVAALTDEEKLAEQDAKIAEENKDKTPEEIKALQDAAKDTRTDDQKAADVAAAAKAEADEKEKQIKDSALQELFKKYGVKSEKELADKLNPVIETEEQKKQKQEVYTAALHKYAVDAKVFDNEELTVYNTLKKMDPQELVYNQFKKDFTDANKGRVDGENKPNPVTEDEIRDGFNELYHIESDNKALQDIGKKNLELKASSIIQPLEQKYNDVKEVFDEDNRKTAAIPGYTKFVNAALDEFIPKEMTFGEGENQAKVVLKNVDREALERMFVKNHYFEDFLQNGGTAEQRAEFEREIKKEIYYQNIDAITKVVGDVREGVGLKKGAVGAKQPFEEQKEHKPVAADSKVLTQDERGSLKKAFA